MSAASKNEYPTEPRVGVGVLVFRPAVSGSSTPQVLVVRRAKEPSKGWWSFPGGSLELGETMTDCAIREVLEETGITLRLQPQTAACSTELDFPSVFCAVDSIHNDSIGRPQFHYVVVNVAARAQPPQQEPTAGDDVDAARWVEADQLHTLEPGVTPSCFPVLKEALQRFHIQ